MTILEFPISDMKPVKNFMSRDEDKARDREEELQSR